MADLTRVQRETGIERKGAGTSEPGRFTGVLASEGEASDGHIISMKGLVIPDQVPLLLNHDRSSGDGNLGSWVADGFVKRSGLLRGTAQVEMEGDGDAAERRRDVALMVERGHIQSFSAGIVATERPVARVNLPKDHPAFVDAKEDGPARFGVFMERSRLDEGSIVTLGADPAAMVGRALEAPEGARDLWEGLLGDDHLQAVLERVCEAVDLAENLGASEGQIRDALDLPAATQEPTGGEPDPGPISQSLSTMLRQVVDAERAEMRGRRGHLLAALRGKS